MTDGDVGFLDALRIARGNVEEDVHFAGECAAGFSRKGDEERSTRARGFNRFDNIGTGAAGGESDDDVMRTDERFHLAGEDAFETVVVSGGGDLDFCWEEKESEKTIVRNCTRDACGNKKADAHW